MLYCGVCHSDCHVGLNDLHSTKYPFVGGHELLGKVVEVGAKVTKHKVGDHVGVGCIVDACLDCPTCKDGDENYCMKGLTGTYNGTRKYGRVAGNQENNTWGGYSGSHVVNEHFAIKIPEGLPLEKAAPILCAGITLYDPIKHWGGCEGKKMTIGIVGLGGLGTMGVKIARALGHDVVAISTSAKKEAMAKEKGATHFVVSTDPESVKKMEWTCDLILNTVSAKHDVNAYLPLLNKSGTIVQLGLVTETHTISQLPLVFHRKAIAGSCIGGIANTQECLDLCAKHNITPDCQMIEANQIDWAWEQLTGSGNADGIRYVIDIKKSLANESFVPK